MAAMTNPAPTNTVNRRRRAFDLTRRKVMSGPKPALGLPDKFPSVVPPRGQRAGFSAAHRPHELELVLRVIVSHPAHDPKSLS